MSLFQNIPENLFSVLSSPNRNLYVEALFILRKAFKSEYTIERDVLLTMLVDRLGELAFSWQEDDTPAGDEAQQPVTNLGDLARILLRRLEQTGWLEIEYKQTSFEELITLPPFAVAILDLLWSLTEEAQQEYGRHAFLVYTLLKSAEAVRQNKGADSETEEAWMALDQAAREAEKLMDALKTLLNNIRRYHRRLNEALTTSDILKGHFDEFQVLINERVYHPLKTRDAVQRYKVPVMTLCDEMLADASFLRRLAEKPAGSSEQTPEQAMDQLILWLRSIFDIFDRVESLLGDIDQKNRAYTRASADRLLYMLSQEENSRGYLVKIIAGARFLEPEQRQVLLQSPVLYRQSTLSHDSLYLRVITRANKDEKPLAIDLVDEAANLQHQQGTAIDAFLRHTANRYSHQRVIDYVMSLLSDRETITSREIPLDSDEAYILVILAIVKQHERQMPYQVHFNDNGDMIACGPYRIPDMILSRKGARQDAGMDKMNGLDMPV
ncbi:MAG: DUF5716 family protein [Bacillota bacterium]|nr:DUF5716 family protein [Bacillota bacterium]